jgi:hypothetical protein
MEEPAQSERTPIAEGKGDGEANDPTKLAVAGNPIGRWAGLHEWMRRWPSGDLAAYDGHVP